MRLSRFLNYVIPFLMTTSPLGVYAETRCPENSEWVCISTDTPAIDGSMALQGVTSSLGRFDEDQRTQSISVTRKEYGLKILRMASAYQEERENQYNKKYSFESNITGTKGLVGVTVDAINLGIKVGTFGQVNSTLDIVKTATNSVLDLEAIKRKNEMKEAATASKKAFESNIRSISDDYFESIGYNSDQVAAMSPQEYNAHLDNIGNVLNSIAPEELDKLPPEAREQFVRRAEQALESQKLQIEKRKEQHLVELRDGQGRVIEGVEQIKMGMGDLTGSFDDLINQHQQDREIFQKYYEENSRKMDILVSNQQKNMVTASGLLKQGKSIKNIRENVLFLKVNQFNKMSASELDQQLNSGILNLKDLTQAGVITDPDAFRDEIARKADFESIATDMTNVAASMSGLADLGKNLGMDPKAVAVLSKGSAVIGGAVQIAAAMNGVGSPLGMINGISGIAGAFGGGGKSAEQARHEALMAEHKKTQKMLAGLAKGMQAGFEAIGGGLNNIMKNQAHISKQITDLTHLTINSFKELMRLQLYTLQNVSFLVTKDFEQTCNEFLNSEYPRWTEVQSSYSEFQQKLNFQTVRKDFADCKNSLKRRFSRANDDNPISNEFYLFTYFKDGNSNGRIVNKIGKNALKVDTDFRRVMSFFQDYNSSLQVLGGFDSTLSLTFMNGFTYDGINTRLDLIKKASPGLSITDSIFIEDRADLNSILSQLYFTDAIMKTVDTSLSFLPFVEAVGRFERLPDSYEEFIQAHQSGEMSDSYSDFILNRAHDLLRIHAAQLRISAGDIMLPIFSKILTVDDPNNIGIGVSEVSGVSDKAVESLRREDTSDPSGEDVLAILGYVDGKGVTREQFFNIANRKALEVMHHNPLIAHNAVRYTIKHRLEALGNSALNYKFAYLQEESNELIQEVLGIKNWNLTHTELKTGENGETPKVRVVNFSYKDTDGKVQSFIVPLPSPQIISAGVMAQSPDYSKVMEQIQRVEEAMILRSWGISTSPEQKMVLMDLGARDT